MQNSLINILAWKAEQQQIDVYGASGMRDLYGGRTHLMGHRDVYGTTQCPGGAAHSLLPDIRDAVASRLNFIDSHKYIDELSDGFTQSNSSWREPTYNCGYNTHAYYTESTSNEAATPYWGEWRFDVAEDGLYQVEVFVPYCNTGGGETRSAQYTVHHANGTSNVTVDQEEGVGLWTSVGQYWLAGGTDHRLRLTDITDDNGRSVWFDTVRLSPVDAPASLQLTAPNDADSWLTSKHVDFSWVGNNLVDSSDIRLQVARDNNFTDVILDESYGTSATHATLTLASNGSFYWRLSATVNGEAIVSPVGQFNVDDSAPEVSVQGVFRFENPDTYMVSLIVTDDGSGLASISTQYREVGSDDWIDGALRVAISDIQFVPPDSEKVYEFQVQAIDTAGNIRAYGNEAEASTAEAILLDSYVYLPLISR